MPTQRCVVEACTSRGVGAEVWYSQIAHLAYVLDVAAGQRHAGTFVRRAWLARMLPRQRCFVYASDGNVLGGGAETCPRKREFIAGRLIGFLPAYLGRRFRLRGKTLKMRRMRHREYLCKAGRAHPTLLSLPRSICLWHTAKQRMSATAAATSSLRRCEVAYLLAKHPNLYHGRGFRPAGFMRLRKDGKVSTYR